ncbi:MAG: sigma-70 family RNA polymerase sigma factor [Thermoanaerobaculia bacterium]|nr:sigma-70 family RNA polymerase sigma factor [Thermoanaerobaculia bacterium]
MVDDPTKEAPVISALPAPKTRPPDAPDALERLFVEHGPRVFRTAFRVTGNAVDAEDVLQTVFLRLAARPDAASIGPEPRAYLHRAAVNGALDLVRSRLSAAGTTPLEERGAEPPARDTPADEALAARELRGRLRQAIGRLAPRVAEVFVLRALEDLPNREIARLLDSSAAVVAVQYFRARTQLKKELTATAGGQP